MQPAATTLAPPAAASSSSSMDSCLAAWMKPHVLTRTTSASCDSSASCQPPSSSRAASSSESTSFRAQPRVTILTRRVAEPGSSWLDDTPADYGNPADAGAPALAPGSAPQRGRAGGQAAQDRDRRSGLRKRLLLAIQVQVGPAGVPELQGDRTRPGPRLAQNARGGTDVPLEDLRLARRGQLHPGHGAVMGHDQDVHARRRLVRDRRRHGSRLLGLAVIGLARDRVSRRRSVAMTRAEVAEADDAGDRDDPDRHDHAPVGSAPLPQLDRREWLEHVRGRNRLWRCLGGVVLADQLFGVQSDRASDVANVTARVEVTTTGRVVPALDATDDGLPDARTLTYLRHGETGLTARSRQLVTDAHAVPPLIMLFPP